jgi:hypothetical protein
MTRSCSCERERMAFARLTCSPNAPRLPLTVPARAPVNPETARAVQVEVPHNRAASPRVLNRSPSLARQRLELSRGQPHRHATRARDAPRSPVLSHLASRSVWETCRAKRAIRANRDCRKRPVALLSSVAIFSSPSAQPVFFARLQCVAHASRAGRGISFSSEKEFEPESDAIAAKTDQRIGRRFTGPLERQRARNSWQRSKIVTLCGQNSGFWILT